MEVDFRLEPLALPVVKAVITIPEDGGRMTGVLTIAGDGEALAYQQNIMLTITTTDAAGVSSSVTRGPFKAVGHFVYDDQKGETEIPVVQQGVSVAAREFIPLPGQSISANLDANWPGLAGKARIPAWLLAVEVKIPIEKALDFADHTEFFAYLLGGYGYYVTEPEHGTGSVLGGGALADYLAAGVLHDASARSRETLSVPSSITVRGQEMKVKTPPEETAAQEKRRLRVAAMLAEARAKGRLSDEEDFELKTDGRLDTVEFTRNLQADQIGYQKVQEYKIKVNRAITEEGRVTTNIRPVQIVDLDGVAAQLTARSVDTTATTHSYAMIGTRRVSTGSSTITTTTQQLIGTAPTLDPPLDLDSYTSRTTVTTRKTWEPGGWVRMLSITTLTQQFKGAAVIYQATSTDVTTWVRTVKGKWSRVQEISTPVEAPVYGADDEIAYYHTIPQTQTKVSPDAEPSEMAPQSDDGLRNLTGDSGGEASYTVTPEGLGITGMYGAPITLEFPYLGSATIPDKAAMLVASQALVDQATTLALQLIGGPRSSRTRTYYTPSGIKRGDGGGSVRSITVTADAEDLEAPYREEVATQWTE